MPYGVLRNGAEPVLNKSASVMPTWLIKLPESRNKNWVNAGGILKATGGARVLI